MAILTPECPKCEKKALIDGDDEGSYCYHCGYRFTPDEIFRAPAIDLIEFIDTVGNPYDMARFKHAEWYPDMVDVRTVMNDAGIGEAVKAFSAVADANPDDVSQIEGCMKMVVVEWLIEQLESADSTYSGGLYDLTSAICRYTPGEHACFLMSDMIKAYLSIPPELDGAPILMNVMESTAVLLSEFMRGVTDLRAALDLCLDYMHFSNECMEMADSLITDFDEMEAFSDRVYSIQDYVRLIGDTLFDAIPESEEMDKLVIGWEHCDNIDFGTDIMDYTISYLEGKADLDGLKTKLDSYISAYMNVVSS